MSTVPDGLRYSKDHEWANMDGTRARIGITDHAQAELTDVVYVELPAAGKDVRQGDVLGTVESVKAVSEILSPLSGKILEVNHVLEERPEVVNKDPYGGGWLVLLEITDPSETANLLDAAGYRRHIGE